MKITLTRDEALDVIWGESDAWETVEEREEGKAGRWTLAKSGIFRRKSDGCCFLLTWEVPATEAQEGGEGPFEYEREVVAVEVVETEVVVKKWVPVPEPQAGFGASAGAFTTSPDFDAPLDLVEGSGK